MLGIAARNGHVVRPLLALTGAQTREYCRDADVRWVEDETNSKIDLARNRIRHEVLPRLREVHPAAEQNMLATIAELNEESAVLEDAIDRAQEAVGAGGDPPAVELSRQVRKVCPARCSTRMFLTPWDHARDALASAKTQGQRNRAFMWGPARLSEAISASGTGDSR